MSRKINERELQQILYKVLLVTYEYHKNSLNSNSNSYVLVPFVDYSEIITKKLKKGDY